MPLSSDSKGFLIADAPLKVGELTQGIEGVRNNTSAILAILQKNNNAMQRARVSNPNSRSSSDTSGRAAGSVGGPPARDPSTGRFMASTVKPVNELSKAVNSLTRQQATQAAAIKRADTASVNRGDAQSRDTKGRFGDGATKKGLFSRMKSRIPGLGMFRHSGGSDLNNIDPSIAATREVGGLLGGPLGLLKSLGGGLLKGGGKLLKGGGGKILRRIPMLGAALAGGSALASIFGGDDPTKSAEENKKDKFTGAGSGIGAIIGGGLGSLLGPLGTIVGGMIGDKLGEMVGAWLSTVDWTAIGASITDGWDKTTSFFQDQWKSVTGKLSDVTTTVSAAWTGIVNGIKGFLKDKFGVDIDAIANNVKKTVAPAVAAVTPVVEAAKEKAKAVVQATAAGAGAVVDYGKERVEKMAAPIGRAYDNAVDATKSAFGGGSKGNKAALTQGMLNAGITDPKEQAMFMAQMDHESGGFRSMEEGIKGYKPETFLKNFGKRAGIKTKAEAKDILGKGEGAAAEAMYGGAWGKKNLGNTEEGDGLLFKGRGFTQLTGRANYAAAAKATGLDLVAHPELAADPANAAKIATWYWQSRKGLADAGKAGDVTASTQKINGGFNGLQERKEKYEHYLAEGSKTQAGPDIPSVAVAAAPMSMPPLKSPSMNIPTAAPLPPTAQANIPMPMGSREPLQVSISNDKLANQDVSDRRLARIATGGIAG